MLPWSFSEETAAEKHMAQLQHNMWVTNSRSAALSIITGGGKRVEMTIPADALYQHFLVTAERRFWRCVQNGETPIHMASSRLGRELNGRRQFNRCEPTPEAGFDKAGVVGDQRVLAAKQRFFE